MIISVDPGSKRCGIAVHEDGELSSAWLVTGTCWQYTAFNAFLSLKLRYPRSLYELATLVIERPQTYPHDPVPAEDLITIAMMGAALAGHFAVPSQVVEYLPKQWKGQTPKKIMCDRIWEKLSPEERSRVELPRNKKHQLDVKDAIGIGRYHLERI